MIEVAVIGAGPSGVAAIKALQAEHKKFRVTCFERQSRFGGVWLYDTGLGECSGKHAYERSRKARHEGELPRNGGWPTPMYDRLYTNVPSSLMGFAEAPMLTSEQFPDRHAVFQYVEQYSEDVRPVVQFDTEVVSLSKRGTFWTVVTKHRHAVETSTAEFDKVVIATGHYESPRVPDIRGLQEALDHVEHSKYYREPAAYAGKRTLVIGGGPSGEDIAIGLIGTAEIVWRSKRSTEACCDADEFGVLPVPEVVALENEGRTARLADGNSLEDIDAIILCTGYHYSVPYLDEAHSDLIKRDGRTLDQVYRFCLYSRDISLAILAQNNMVLPFPFAQAQACWVARIWSGRLPAPSNEAIEKWRENWLQEGSSMSLAHPADGAYIDALLRDCRAAGPSGLMPVDWANERLEIRSRVPDLKLADRRRRKMYF
ncbi:hypothetical protein PYCC9005_005106 [Savitreella phatthalungensis]